MCLGSALIWNSSNWQKSWEFRVSPVQKELVRPIRSGRVSWLPWNEFYSFLTSGIFLLRTCPVLGECISWLPIFCTLLQCCTVTILPSWQFCTFQNFAIIWKYFHDTWNNYKYHKQLSSNGILKPRLVSWLRCIDSPAHHSPKTCYGLWVSCWICTQLVDFS